MVRPRRSQSSVPAAKPTTAAHRGRQGRARARPKGLVLYGPEHGGNLHHIRHRKNTVAGKLIISIGSYAYDWAGFGKGKELSVQEAWSLIGETRSRLQVDARSLNPMFVYRDDIGNIERTVWFLDGTTAFNHVAAALAMQPAGLALWRLGTEDPTVWATFGRGRMADATALERLVDVPYSADVIYKGEGEVLSASGEPRNGLRSVAHDASQNLITAQTFRNLPTSIVVTRDGARRDEKLIALTFDDGPDPVYTPQILDILAQKNVKGSFFIVGSMGVLNKDLIRRIYLEGHDIGNHTFTHVNSSNISADHMRIELNATQRLIEATVGVRTRLFRPPYATDIEPQSIDSALPLKVSSELGYITIGMKIDPKDWLRTDPKAVVAHTLTGARRGDGNVVLLHDAGGLRNTTIKALPVIIDTLKSEGFRFVTIHELLGLPRSDLMPASDGGLVTSLNRAGFSFLGGVNYIGYALFYIGIALGMMRLIWVAGAAIIHKWREHERAGLMYRPKRFTVVVPAYNEAKVIEKTIRSILASNCTGFRVLVVDDGSTDGTADLVEQRFANDPRVRVLRKSNGGKWSALNAALRATTDDVIVTLDADTVLDPHALRLIVRHFGDPRVGAVAGHASIGNINNLLTRFQAIEYITNQNLDRRALELVNGITVVPGAIGAWRRKALMQIGRFEADTLAEDADATVRLGIAGWRVLYEPDAIARTEAPETVRSFMSQRHRWMFGTLQVAYKSVPEIVRKRPAGLAFFGLPNIVVFQFAFTLVAPLIDVLFAWALVSGAYSFATNPEAGIPAGIMVVVSYWLAFQCLELLVGALGVALDGRRVGWRLLWVLLLQRFFYRQLLYITACRVTYAALKGKLQDWGKLTRTGNVPRLGRS